MDVKTVQHGQVTLAWHTEDVAHALLYEAFDEQVAADFGAG